MRQKIDREAPDNGVRILPAERRDLEAIAQLNVAAILPDLLTQLLFPGRSEKERVASLLEALEAKWEVPGAHFLKAEDAHKRVIGSAIWMELDGSEEEEDLLSVLGGMMLPLGAVAGAESKDPLKSLLDALKKQQVEWFGGKRSHFLTNLAVHPNNQGHGVASALMHVVHSAADRQGIVCGLGASPDGYPVYRHLGWHEIGVVSVDLAPIGGEDRGYGLYRIRTMLRLPDARLDADSRGQGPKRAAGVLSRG